MRLIYYNPKAVISDPRRDVAMFSRFFDYYGVGTPAIDRTETIRVPLALKSLFPVPKSRPFTKTYEEICDARAREILSAVEKMDAHVYVSWSGGIDSTLVLVSLLKSATPAQRDRIVVELNEKSIGENPRFWQEHIHGKLRIDSSVLFAYRLGTKNIMLDGELNDQLFGTDQIGKFMWKFGDAALHKRVDRDMLFSFFDNAVANPIVTGLHMDQFDRLVAASPIAIETNALYLWWINFSLLWQGVYYRKLVHAATRNIMNVDQKYVDTRFIHFFSTEDFQLWSLNNPDKRIKDTWNTYKWPAKDIIYKYTEDADYRDNKVKRGSQRDLFLQQHSYRFIDEDMTFHEELPLESYYNPDNDYR